MLNVLQDLPEAQRFVDVLEDVLDRGLKTIGWGPAPSSYTDKLSAIIAQLKRGSGPSSLSSLTPAESSKRPASSLERKAKRMK